MGKLNARHRALTVDEPRDARERLDVLIVPDTQILRRDAPLGQAAVASTMTSPAPPAARLPRCTRCQSLAKPSSAEYWHIGETAMRLRKVTPRRFSGVRRSTSGTPKSCRVSARPEMAAYLATGAVTREMLPMFAIVAPAMLIPVLLGARLYIGLSEEAFRKVVLTLLTASGIALLVSALPHLWHRL